MSKQSTTLTALIVPGYGKQQSTDGTWYWLWQVIDLNGKLLYKTHAHNADEALSFYDRSGSLFMFDSNSNEYISNPHIKV